LYHQISEIRAKHGGALSVYVIAPDATSVTQGILAHNGITVDAVLQASLESVGAPGTPEVFIVNSSGVITQRFIGQLDATGERTLVSDAETLAKL